MTLRLRLAGAAGLVLLAGCGAKTGLRTFSDADAGRFAPEGGSGVDAPATLDATDEPRVEVDAGSIDADAAPHLEVCNGIDDDLYGVIDDGFVWRAEPGIAAVRVSTDANALAEPSGTSSNGETYVAFYEGGASDSQQVYATPLDRFGRALEPEAPLTPQLSHSHGGTVHGRAIAWTGDRHGAAWIDLRDGGDGEIYFALLGPDATKLVPGDVLVSDRGGFAFNPSLAWTGDRFVVAWSGFLGQAGLSTRILVRTIDVDGAVGPPSAEATRGLGGNHDAPFVAATRDQVAVGWVASDRDEVRLALFDQSLQRLTDPMPLTPPGTRGDFVRIARVDSSWAVFWHGTSEGHRTIWGTRVDDTGNVISEPRRVVDTPGYARYPYPMSLGDRILLVYSDDRDATQGYEVYVTMIDASLAPMDPAQRVTRADADSIFPSAAFGPEGDLGVTFRDDRLGWGQVFFARLPCTDPSE